MTGKGLLGVGAGIAAAAAAIVIAVSLQGPEVNRKAKGGEDRFDRSSDRIRGEADQRLEQAALEHEQAARLRELADGTDDPELSSWARKQAARLEASAERLNRWASKREQWIADLEAERARFHPDRPGRLPDDLIGNWEVSFIDRVHGPQVGAAKVGRDGRTIEVSLADRTLAARSVGFEGETVVIELAERDPSANSTHYRPPGEAVRTAGTTVVLALGDGESRIQLATPDPVEAGVVRLRLTASADRKSLTGYWTQRLDAVTGRDAAGGGRHGTPIVGSRSAGGMLMFGHEAWHRPETRIKLAFATENQSAIDDVDGQPYWPDPDGRGSLEGEVQAGSDGRRVLYVIGEGIPEIHGEPMHLESLDDDVTYSVHSLKEDMEREDYESFYGRVLRAAEAKLEATTTYGELPVPIESDDPVMLINAQLGEGVVPGIKTFRLNGAEASWQLTFGDHRAEVVFVRDLAEGLTPRDPQVPYQSEDTDILFLPETFAVEVRARRPLPYSEIPLFLTVNGKPVLLNGTRRIPALPVEEAPLLFRTAPLRLVEQQARVSQAAGSLQVGAEPGDRLGAVVDLEPATLLRDPPVTVARVAAHPSEAPRLAPLAEGDTALSWPQAVRRAAACVGEEFAGRTLEEVAALPAATESRFIFLAWLDNNLWLVSLMGGAYRELVRAAGRQLNLSQRQADVDAPTRLEVNISVGQLAAMIQTRRVLLHALREQRRDLDELRGAKDSQILGFRRILEPTMLGDTPWDDLRVAAPTQGGTLAFPQTYYDHRLAEFGLEGPERTAYQVRATREALTKILSFLDTAIQVAQGFEECEAEDMSLLTGLGMHRIIARARPVLMRFTGPVASDGPSTNGGHGQRWVADRQARVHFDALEPLAASLTEQNALGDWDTAITLLFASAVVLPVGTWGGVVGAQIALAFDAGNTLISTVGGLQTELAEDRELTFARGAAVAIGNDRYRVARELDVSYGGVILNAIVGLGQTGVDVVSIRMARTAQAALRRSAIEAGRAHAARLLGREVSLAALSERESAELALAVAEARALEKTLGREALETAEFSALHFADLVETGEFSAVSWSTVPPTGPDAPPPSAFDPQAGTGQVAAQGDDIAWWGHGLGSGAYRRLRELAMVERDDVIRMALTEPDALTSALATNETLEALYRPQQSVDSLVDDARRLADRAPPRGRRFFGQSHPDRGDPDHLHYVTKLSEDGSTVVVEVYSGRPAPRPGAESDLDFITDMVEQEKMASVGYFELGLQPDAIFDSGRRTLVIDTVQTFPNVDVGGRPVLPGQARPQSRGPAWVRDVEVPLRDDAPGAPFAMHSQHHGMQALGVEYADATIGAVKLQNVESANTAIELHWMQRNFPTTPVSDLVRRTSLYRHVESMLEQAGFRVVEVRFARDLEWALTAPSGELVRGAWFNPGRLDGAPLAKARANYLHSFGLDGSEQIEIGFDIHLRVEPLGP